ncbi:unnamed protein product [Cuscuta campestris]|uniref:Uncharacterized protein n=1 Tax=Cuscuta campestris TaxID=132261 RepID=A0A484LY34_9ASTE|nr:unnamed protein product [Cuscuta campestris]
MDRHDLVAFNKNDDERLSLGMASLEPRTTVETNGSSDGPLELTKSGWAAPEWKCTEQTQSNPIKRNDTSAERAISLIESAGFPSTRASVDVEMVHKGDDQANKRSDEKIPDIIESAELGSSWHSDEHNIQRRSNIGDSNVSHTTTLQSILHSPNMQRSVSEEPKVVADELHLQEEGNAGEPNARADDMKLNEIKDAVFPPVGSCVKPTLRSSISVEDVNVLAREEAPNSVHDKDTRDTHGEKTFTSFDGSKFPHSEPVLELGVEGDIEEHVIVRVEGRFSVHIYKSSNQDLDMVGGLD